MSSIRVERGFAWEEHKCAIFIASYHLCSVLFIWHLNIWFLALGCVRLVGVISLRLSASYRFYPYLSYFASYILLSILIHLHGVKKLGGAPLSWGRSLSNFFANREAQHCVVIKHQKGGD